MNIIIIEYKKIFVYKDQIQRVQKKIKNFNIIINKTIVIITLNNFDFEFKIYLTIINNKTRNNKKLFKLDAFIKVLQKKKIRLHNVELHFNKASSLFKDFKRNKRDKSRDKKNNNNSNKDFINITSIYYKQCDILYSKNYCLNKNVVCNNCKKKKL